MVMSSFKNRKSDINFTVTPGNLSVPGKKCASESWERQGVEAGVRTVCYQTNHSLGVMVSRETSWQQSPEGAKKRAVNVFLTKVG